MKKLSSWMLGACSALFCAVSALPALAQESSPTLTVTPIVDTTGLQTQLVTSLQSWVLIGLGVGIALVVVLLGWKWIRKFMGR